MGKSSNTTRRRRRKGAKKKQEQREFMRRMGYVCGQKIYRKYNNRGFSYYDR